MYEEFGKGAANGRMDIDEEVAARMRLTAAVAVEGKPAPAEFAQESRL